MTKREKLIERFLTKPKDFTWDELVNVLNGFGYNQMSVGKTAGSRVRFIHPNLSVITLHKPHPRPLIKQYQLDQIINLLGQEELL